MRWWCWLGHAWQPHPYALVGEPQMTVIVCTRCGQMRALHTPQPR